MHVLKCDNCEATTRIDHIPPTWFTIDTDVQDYSVHGAPWHLCSWRCVQAFAIKRENS